MLTRRAALAATVGALAASADVSAWSVDGLEAVLDGDGEPRHALVGIAGAAGWAGRGGTLEVALGRAHVDPDRALATISPARIASISKHVTAIGLMRLVEAGRVGLGDDASDHLGFALRHPLFPQTSITVRMLLSHTSGVRNGPSYPVPFGRPLQAAFTPGGVQFDAGGWWGPQDQPPGWFRYADANFACVAQIVERTTGERFDRYMRAQVLGPLGLEAGFNWSGVGQDARDRAAALYRKGLDETHFVPDGPWVAQLDQSPPTAPDIHVARAPEAAHRPLDSYRPGENGFVFAPQGGLRICVRDLLAVGRMMAGGGALGGRRILRPETVALMHEPVWRYDPAAPNGEPYGGGSILAYGLGTCVLTGQPGPRGDDLFPGCSGWVGHLGEAYGLLSGLWVEPGSGRAIAYFTNGVSSSSDQNPGTRSAFTWQEERIAADLAARATGRTAFGKTGAGRCAAFGV